MAPVDERRAHLPAFETTSSGTRLLKLAGLPSYDRLYEEFEVTNLFRYPQATATWPKGRARGLAARLVRGLLPGVHRHVVLLGGAVAEAFDVPYRPFYELHWRHTPSWRAGERWTWAAAVMPHPSGTVLHWNDPPARDEARAFLCALGGYEPEVEPWR
jgi:hypothetical protein